MKVVEMNTKRWCGVCPTRGGNFQYCFRKRPPPVKSSCFMAEKVLEGGGSKRGYSTKQLTAYGICLNHDKSSHAVLLLRSQITKKLFDSPTALVVRPKSYPG